jgi:hypothetical protein
MSPSGMLRREWDRDISLLIPARHANKIQKDITAVCRVKKG